MAQSVTVALERAAKGVEEGRQLILLGLVLGKASELQEHSGDIVYFLTGNPIPCVCMRLIFSLRGGPETQASPIKTLHPSRLSDLFWHMIQSGLTHRT